MEINAKLLNCKKKNLNYILKEYITNTELSKLVIANHNMIFLLRFFHSTNGKYSNYLRRDQRCRGQKTHRAKY